MTLYPISVQEVIVMNNTKSTNNLKIFGNLGEVFAAYIQTIAPRSHREPLRAELLSKDGDVCMEATALTVLKMISKRKGDGISYTCESDFSDHIPKAVKIRTNCSRHYWWNGTEDRPWTSCYDQTKGYFDLYPYTNPFGTDFSKGIHLTYISDPKTGEVLKDNEGRNLAVYGYLKWSLLVPAAVELFQRGIGFDFMEDGARITELAHVGSEGCLKQNPKTGKWRSVRN